MGLIIISNEIEEVEEVIKDLNCIVCTAEKPESFLNDIEKIFWVLNHMPRKEMSSADNKMCEKHAKKAKGLKIMISEDELFELDSQTINKNVPKVKRISENEYKSMPELNNEIEM